MGNEPDVDVKCDPGSADNAIDTAKNKNAGAQAGLQRPPNASLAEPVARSENADVQVGIMDGVEQYPEIPQKSSHAMPKNNIKASIARHISITPLDAFILHMLHFSDRDMSADEIAENVRKWFGETKSMDIRISLVDILADSLMYVNESRVKDGDGNILNCYAASAKAREEYFSIPSNRQRSKIVLETMSRMANQQRRVGRYCHYNLGNSAPHLPSLVVLEPETRESGDMTFPSPSRWDPKTVTAIDVKADSTKHPGRTYRNWKKSADQNIHTLFVAFDVKQMRSIQDALNMNGADRATYTIRVITKEMVGGSQDPEHFELPHLGDSKYLPECALKPVQADTGKAEPHGGSGGKTTVPTDAAQLGKPATTPDTPDGNAPAVPKVEGGGPVKATEPEGSGTELTDDMAVHEQDDSLGTREMQHMSNLEREIYYAINEGLSIEPDSIRIRLGKKEYVPDSSIRKAVSNLCKKKYVIIDYQTKLNKMDSLRGKGPKKTYYRKAIIRKAVLEEDTDPQIGSAKVVPTGAVDDTARNKMVVYSDSGIENMGNARLRGLLMSARTTEHQKDKVMEVLKAKGLALTDNFISFK